MASLLNSPAPSAMLALRAADTKQSSSYHTRDFVEGCRERRVTPHVADKDKHSALDGRTTAQPGYSISQRIRKRIEEIFGWTKTVGAFRRTRFRGRRRTQLAAYLVGAAYNLVRMAKLAAAPG